MSQGSLELLQMLADIDPSKPYGTTLFDSLARLTVSVAVEAVCLRLETAPPSDFDEYQYRNVEAYLTQRSADDTAYAGEWHCPGTVLRPKEDIGAALRRLAEREFGTNLLSTAFVANVNNPEEARGHFFSLVYLCLLEEKEGLRGKWFPVHMLPEKTIIHHRTRIIPTAIGAFVAGNNHISLNVHSSFKPK